MLLRGPRITVGNCWPVVVIVKSHHGATEVEALYLGLENVRICETCLDTSTPIPRHRPGMIRYRVNLPAIIAGNFTR